MSHTRKEKESVIEQELKFEDRIILVSSVQADSAMNYLTSDPSQSELVMEIFEKGLDPSAAVIERTESFLRKDGTIAAHLHFKNEQYTDTFVDRPHMHWTWNGLVQANSGGDWELATIAYLEPLSEFSGIYSCAPYDTMTIGHHKLSAKSIILVPEAIADKLRQRMTRYEGTILSYNPETSTLREAVATILKEAYPDAFVLINKNDTEINKLVVSDGKKKFDIKTCTENDYNQNCGYFNSYYVAASESKKVKLLDSPHTVRLKEYHEYTQGRHVGLHQGSPTDIEKCDKFKKLKNVSENPDREIPANMNVLAGLSGKKKIHQLLSVITYKKYVDLTDSRRYCKATGTHDYAEYLVKKALIADLRSIHVQSGSSTPLTMTLLKDMIEDNFDTLLDSLRVLSDSQTPTSLMDYRKTLMRAYEKVLPLKLETVVAHPKAVKMSGSKHGFWNRHGNKVMLGVGAVVIGSLITAAFMSKKQ